MNEWARQSRRTPEGKLKQKINSRRSRLNNPESVKIRKKRNYLKYRGKYTEYYKERYRLCRLEMLEHYSNGKLLCACCGESNYDFLTLDHMDGGGVKHRKEVGASNLPNWLKKNDYPEGYQVLCYNCNCGRQRNAGICPHQNR